jgi:L-ascorbate metabolism protein UlaG (beta-lactamase superfamily)
MLLHTLPLLALIGLSALAAAPAPTLTYFGRASVKLVSAENYVIYIDPFAPGDYSQPADLVLVTHGHGDHNKVDLVTLKPNGVVVAPVGAVPPRDHRPVKEGDAFSIGPVQLRAVAAYNKNHRRAECVGYLVTVDKVKLYHAGDTSLVPEMADLAPLGVDYALFPTDGFYNMDGAEARRCADLVKARHAMAIHSSPKEMYDAERAAQLKGPDVLALAPGQTLALTR